MSKVYSMKMKNILLCVCGALILTGCVQGPSKAEVDAQHNTDQLIQKNLTDTADKVSQMQYGLYRNGVGLNTSPGLAALTITSDAQFINVDWNGDAITLLSTLAHARGQTFAFSGVRLPLPVSLHEVNIPYWSVLDHIQAQTGYRALIVIDNNANSVELQFNAPNVRTTDHRVAVLWKGGSRTSAPTVTPAPAYSISPPANQVTVVHKPTQVASVPQYVPGTASPLTTKPATGCVPGTGAVQLIWN